MHKTDICILGAGPAGATAALHLANKGIPSLLLDKASFPRDKVCGDALSGKVVNELRRIAPDLPEQLGQQQEALPSWGIHFISPGGHKLSVPFKYNYNPGQDIPAGYISKRIHFDNFLIEQVRLRPEIALWENVDVAKYEREPEGGFILSGKQGEPLVQAKLLLVANGAQSGFTRHVAGLEQEPEHYCAGLRAYYKGVEGMDADGFIELHFFKDFLPGYFWIFPLPDGHANVGVGMLSSAVSRKKVNLKKEMQLMIASHPELQKRFAKAELVDDIRGFGLPLGSRKRVISGDNYMLLGDAGALIDPFTGEGISNAMISGRWAAEQAEKCLQQQEFSARFMQGYDKAVYNRLWKELKLSRQMQKLLNYPWLFDKVASKASKNQALAETISCMFNDLDLRERLRQPSFYAKLLFN
ncbi:NAD(P)/FAD-dependent oxidoreductase [Pontibacter anaerobius]|uniref:Geranylgeranyl reductase family protein n=1 Tax=Pontibacter anaerobius TaxID=2993940 RepID=A0ABT3RJ82_9BACT|nr:geranylgeranyl reductase family protein [Pontibacter anaerobius]MCX2741433.1 geranylgeranyl reductase family protein [Pontibacter anaerobius]